MAEHGEWYKGYQIIYDEESNLWWVYTTNGRIRCDYSLKLSKQWIDKKLKEAKIKPCPFCGAEINLIKLFESDGFLFNCTKCRVNLTFGYLNREDTIKLWNTRREKC